MFNSYTLANCSCKKTYDFTEKLSHILAEQYEQEYKLIKTSISNFILHYSGTSNDNNYLQWERLVRTDLDIKDLEFDQLVAITRNMARYLKENGIIKINGSKLLNIVANLLGFKTTHALKSLKRNISIPYYKFNFVDVGQDISFIIVRDNIIIDVQPFHSSLFCGSSVLDINENISLDSNEVVITKQQYITPQFELSPSDDLDISLTSFKYQLLNVESVDRDFILGFEARLNETDNLNTNSEYKAGYNVAHYNLARIAKNGNSPKQPKKCIPANNVYTTEYSLEHWCEMIDFNTDILKKIILDVLKNNSVEGKIASYDDMRVVAFDNELHTARFKGLLNENLCGGCIEVKHPMTEQKIQFSNNNEVSFVLGSVILSIVMSVVLDSYNKDKRALPEQIFLDVYANIEKEIENFKHGCDLPFWIARNKNIKRWGKRMDEMLGDLHTINPRKIIAILD